MIGSYYSLLLQKLSLFDFNIFNNDLEQLILIYNSPFSNLIEYIYLKSVNITNHWKVYFLL